MKDGEAAAVDYLHNALGQRVFKSQPLAEQTLPDEKRLGRGFISWLKDRFGWLFSQARPRKATLGLSFAYDEDTNLIGEYDNGSAQGLGSTEYIWLPVDGGNAIPVGIYRNGKFYQVHSDHLGTPRLVTDSANAPVWQWPYSAFGNNRTTGVMTATPTSGAITLKATKAPVAVNLRFPGQYFDEESNLSQNGFRSYRPLDGGFTQMDPIGLPGGMNRRGYVGANPLSFIDLLGLQASPDDRPSVPGLFLPNPSAAAQMDLAKMLDKVFCQKDPDCWDLQQQMEEVAGELRQRHVSMTADVGNLFCTRPIGRFSWLGHQMKFHDKQRQLQKLIAQAQAKGCSVNGEYIKLASMTPPSCPTR
jgi:RHS repeat-associated protein